MRQASRQLLQIILGMDNGFNYGGKIGHGEKSSHSEPFVKAELIRYSSWAP
jgi:hypothetical protein